jgi:L-malate glycosyltransferase
MEARTPTADGTRLAAVRPVSVRIPLALVLTSFEHGGTERQTTELIRRLDRGRFEVHVACFRREGPWLDAVTAAAGPVAEFRLGSFASPGAARQLRRFAAWLRQCRIAVLQAFDLYANVFALPGAWLAGVPVRIGSRRGIVSPTAQRRLLWLQRAGYAAAHRIVANSAAAAAQLRREGVASRRIAVIENGIDLDRFPPAGAVARTTITCVANLRPGKGQDVLLRAAAIAARTHPQLHVQLVGNGPLRGTLEEQTRALGLDGRVSLLGHRDDVAAILQQSGIFVLPSAMEAFPNSVMEAMASGLPVVATDVGGIPELVSHEHTGLLVPSGDERALATALLRLIDDEALASRLGASARASIADRFSFARMLHGFESLYLSELDLRRQRRDPLAAAAPRSTRTPEP